MLSGSARRVFFKPPPPATLMQSRIDLHCIRDRNGPPDWTRGSAPMGVGDGGCLHVIFLLDSQGGGLIHRSSVEVDGVCVSKLDYAGGGNTGIVLSVFIWILMSLAFSVCVFACTGAFRNVNMCAHACA